MPDRAVLDKSNIRRLYDSIGYSRKSLKPFRQKRVDALEQYVGQNYSDDGPEDEVPLNLLELAVQTYKHLLAAKAPRELVTTPFRRLRNSALLLELALERLAEEIHLKETLQMAVFEALFSIGIVKIGLEHGGTVEIDGETHELGQPYCDVVHLDDWVHDCTATKWGEMMYRGNRYRIPLEDAKANPRFDRKIAAALKPSEFKTDTEEGDSKAAALSQSQRLGDAEFMEMVDLWDIYLPRENMVLTLPLEDDTTFDKPLGEVEYAGPEGGPYHRLAFSPVPQNAMPLPVVAPLMDMQLLINSLMRKLSRQAKRQKSFMPFRSGDEKDAQRIKKTRDGELVNVDNPDALKEVSVGGIDPRTLAFLIQTKQLFSYEAGNLDSLAGLGPQAKTLGQEKLISGSASKRIQEMSLTVTAFDDDVMKALAWYLWTDPFIQMPLTKRIEGTDMEVATAFTPEAREGDFLDYNFKMEPYSMTFMSPEDRLMVLNGVIERVTPFMPMMEKQGITFNVKAYLEAAERLTNVSEVRDMFIFSGATEQDERPMIGKAPTKAPNSHHVYERVNRPGATEQGQDAAMMQTLLGGQPQEAEMAGIGRGVG